MKTTLSNQKFSLFFVVFFEKSLLVIRMLFKKLTTTTALNFGSVTRAEKM